MSAVFGREIPKDNEALRRQYFEEKKLLFEQGCDENLSNSCYSLGEWYQLVAKDVAKAATIYEDNCFKNNHGNSCANLARLYFSKHKTRDQMLEQSKQKELKKLQSSPDRALFLFEKACDSGTNSQSCTSYATLKLYKDGISKKEFNSALQSLKNRCEDGDPRACLRVGSLFLKPGKKLEPHVTKDPSKAYEFMKKGCDIGLANCCHTLAVMYKKGDGVEKSDDLFKEYKALTEEIVKHTGEKLGKTTI